MQSSAKPRVPAVSRVPRRVWCSSIVLCALSTLACGATPDASAVHGRAASPLIEQVTTTDLGLGVGSVAIGVNNLGVVVGEYTPVGGAARHAFRYESGTLLDLHPDSSVTESRARRINDAGMISGEIGDEIWSRYATYAARSPVIWSASGTHTVIASTGRVTAVNSSAQAAGTLHGSSILTEEKDRGFFWSEATGLIDIGDLGGGSTRVSTMNENGTIVGSSSDASGASRAFVWRLGEGMTNLGTLGGSSEASAINDLEEIVGSSEVAPEQSHAVKWVNGVIQDLHPAGSGPSSFASDVNNGGDVVGSVAGRAVLWRGGQMMELDAGPASYAGRITDDGLVIGVRVEALGNPSGLAFVWLSTSQGPIDLPAPAGTTHTDAIDIAGKTVVGFAFTNSILQPTAAIWTLEMTSPLPPAESPLDALREEVASIGDVVPGVGTALDTKLESAAKQCARGNEQAARNQIEAFVNQVKALVRSGKLSTEQGQTLIDMAEAILTNLEC